MIASATEALLHVETVNGAESCDLDARKIEATFVFELSIVLLTKDCHNFEPPFII